MVPSLVAFFLIDHHVAQGVAISVALADSLAGVITHARAKNINYRVVLYLAAPAMVAAAGGALLSNSLPSVALRYVFVVFLVSVWVSLLVRLIVDYLQVRTASRVELVVKP